jgi:hypothetical protein
MSTRSGIGVVMLDGSVCGISCHSSGGLEQGGVGWMLATFYASPERACGVVKLGDCSRLQPGLGRRHEFGKAPANWSTFYGRDRGEPGREFRRYLSVAEFVRERAGCLHAEFLYLLSSGGWQVCEVDLEAGVVSEWMSLAEVLTPAG